MDLSAALGFAWNFSRSRERIGLFLSFFVGCLVAFAVLLLLVFALAGGAILSAGGLQSAARNPGLVFAAIGGIIFFFIILFVFVLAAFGVWLWLSAGIMKNAASEILGERASLRGCLDYAKTRFWVLVASILLVIVVSFIVELPFSLLQLLPFVGVFFILVTVLVRLALQLGFFFAQYEVVIAGEGAVDSLRKSFDLFLKKPLDVFIVFVALIVALVILFLLSLIAPLVLAVIAAALFGAIKSLAGVVIAVLVGAAAALVFLAEIAFLEVFSEGFLAFAFLDLNGASGASRTARAAFVKPASKAPLPRASRAALPGASRAPRVSPRRK
jgi:hypothetical protein